MLQVRQIHKEYKTGGLVQKALDGVSLNLRENEFVAILGPSGSGKTTLLNIIGGLDRYDSGDLIINGISTKKYKDRDWDSYRNHTIGFVFQSYNLIPHQTVLANVELALTISGISRKERRERAKKALEEVGLGAQLHKKPNQMSGGQMQRVAIARALVNNPDILLADEPTGALDSDTSIQVMELLKQVAKERLVVMVTHNPELAEEYATRIVELRDGKIRSDSDPFEVEEEELGKPVHKNMGKSSMSLLTALSLSFNNLKTKKARTLLTSFAGSIGIIGIALILAISNGVNGYIKSMEEDTLSEYPLQINSTGFDLTSMMVGMSKASEEGDKNTDQIGVAEMVTNMFSKMNSNDLESLKTYLDSSESGIADYANSVEYSYQIAPQIYREDGRKIRQVNPDQSFSSMGIGSTASSNSLMSMTMSTDVFYEMPQDPDLYETQYDVKAGRWPQNYRECILVLTGNGNISDFLLYTLGLRDTAELDEMVKKFAAEEEVTVPTDDRVYTYDDVLGTTFKLVQASDYYEYDEEYKVWKDKTGDKKYMRQLVKDGEELTIVGIVQPSEDAGAAMLTSGIGYTPELTRHVIQYAADSDIVKEQLRRKNTNVFTDEAFGEDRSDDKFDMASMFQVDEDALAKAFGMDGLDGMAGGMDLSGLSGLSDMNFSMPDLSQYLTMDGADMDLSGLFQMDQMDMDWSSLINTDDLAANMPKELDVDFDLTEFLKGLEISVTPQDLQALATNLWEGYEESVKDKPEADVSNAGEDLMKYMGSEELRTITAQSLQKMAQENIKVSLTYADLLTAATELAGEYQAYAAANDMTGAGAEGILGYLASEDVQNEIREKAEKIIREGVQITAPTQEQRREFGEGLYEDYQKYAAANNLVNPSSVETYFLQYLQSEDGQKRLSDSVSTIVGKTNLKEKASEVMGQYMQKMMEAYMKTMGDTLKKQMASVTENLSGQIAEGIQSSMVSMMEGLASGLQSGMGQMIGQLTTGLGTAMGQAMSKFGVNVDPEAFADAIQVNMGEDDLTELLMSMMSGENASYDSNLKKLGYADLKKPGGIDIYPKDFEAKEQILQILDNYNLTMERNGEDEKVITYTDMVGTLMSSVTQIVDIISYVLVAFVAISLVVSSIMIGVITYISVLERKKEIGILRAIGASKRNISQVFNAETFIIGFFAGMIGIGLTLLLMIPGNRLIHSLADRNDINAVLPVQAAAILILLSVFLTLLGGLIPSRKAAKNDPVTALRTE